MSRSLPRPPRRIHACCPFHGHAAPRLAAAHRSARRSPDEAGPTPATLTRATPIPATPIPARPVLARTVTTRTVATRLVATLALGVSLLIAGAAGRLGTAAAATSPGERASAAGGHRAASASAAQRRAAAPARAVSTPRAHLRRATAVATSGARPTAREATHRRPAAARPNTARPATARPAPRPEPPLADSALPVIRPELLAALDEAASARGASPALLFAVAWRESRMDPQARNPASSARGLMQFTQATWLETVRDHGPDLGLESQAAALSTNPATGEITTRDPRVMAEILALREDPRLAAVMALARMEAERPGLARALRRPPSAADLYLVHFLGPAGARRFLQELARGPSRPAADAVGPEAVEANRNIFYARDGRALSLRAVHQDLGRFLHTQRRVHAAVVARRRDAPEAQGRLEVASAR